MSPKRYDALVIGAGMSGLAAGIRVAQAGRSVAILERHALWGGLNSFFKRGGRRYDTGLHALTNFATKGERGAPLTKLLRALRIPHEALRLCEQTHSTVELPGISLRFSNDFALFESEVARAFPSERDGFARLVDAVRAADPFRLDAPSISARAMLAQHLRDPALVDALLLPLCYYGSAIEGDVDWDQFVILFRSVFLEGFARPEGGIKTLLDLLVERFRSEGGELRMRNGVESIRLDARGAACGVRLDDGTELESECILSSAGAVETLALCGREVVATEIGRMSFFECLRVTSTPHRARGHAAVMTFFSTSERFAYRAPDELVDPSSGVVCCTDNYQTPESPTTGLVRVSLQANAPAWLGMSDERYAREKARAEEQALDAASRFVPDPRGETLAADAFTPRTIRRYTGHANGAVYGSPRKRRDGDLGIPHVRVIGTDQGNLGVVGALLSGIAIANRHALMSEAGT